MKGHIMYQRLYGLILMPSFIFLSVASENITIQETSTTLSQQIDLTTPSQVTGLKSQKTAYSSTMISKNIPVFANDYTTISYSNTTFPSLEAMTAPKILKTSIAETATFRADILSTSAAIALPTKNTFIDTTTNSMKITKSPSSENTMTTKSAGAIVTDTFHPTTATNFLYTSGFTKNSIVSKTSAIGSQPAIMKTPSLCSSVESTTKSTPSLHKHKSTGIGTLPISIASQEFLASTVAGTVPWSRMKQTSTHIGTATAFQPMPVLISTAAPANTVFPRNQKAPTLAMTDTKISFTVHSMTLPTKPIVKSPKLRTVEIELTSTNFQDVSSPRVEDITSISMPKEVSSMVLSFRTSSSFTGAPSVQTNIDAETTHTALTPGITLAPTADESMLSPTVTGSVYTKNTSTGGENFFLLISTRSKATESGPTKKSDEGEIDWTSRADQTLLTSISNGNTSNTEHSSTAADIIIPPEASTESEATTTADAIITTDAIIDRYTAVLSNLTSLCLANFSTVSGTTSVNKLSEFKLTTLLLRTTPMSTVAGNELLSTPKETVVPPVDVIPTLADIGPYFSTEESAPETTQTKIKNTIAFGEKTIPVPESATTQTFDATVTRKEKTSHYLKGRSTIATTTEVSPFATMLEATDESVQAVIASVTVSPFPDLEKSTDSWDNKTATTEVRGSWLSSKSVKTTPKKTSCNGTTEIFNSTHTYTAQWTSETPPEGNPTPSPTSGSTKTFPEPLVTSTIRILEISFATIPTDRTAMSLSTDILPPQPTATHSSATPVPITCMFSLPVNVSAVTSVAVSEETKVIMSEPSALPRVSSTSELSDVSTLSSTIVTTALVSTLDQTASTTSDIVTPTAISFLTETPVPSLRSSSPVATNAETTLLSTTTNTVTLSTSTLACSKSPPDNISVVASTHMISTISKPIATQPTSRVEETSTHALSLPYTFSGRGDDVNLITATTDNYVIDETMFSHTSVNKLSTSNGHISQFSTHLANTLIPTLSVTDISTLSSDKEQMITSLKNTLGTMEVTEMSPSKPFISESQSFSTLEMTDTGFAETTKISSHQTHSPSEIPLVTACDGTSASSPTSGNTQTTPTTLGMSEIPSLSIFSESIPSTSVDIKQPFGKTTISGIPGTTFPSNPSRATLGSIISKTTISPMLAWILSSLPSGSPLTTVPNTPHMITSSAVEVQPTRDSLQNITTITSTATEDSFPLTSTGVTHPSTAAVSSPLSSSFETTWLDSTSSFLTTETLTSAIAIESTVSFYNIGMSFSIFDEEPAIPFTGVVNELVQNWLNSIFQDSEFALANLAIQIKSRDTSKEETTMDQNFREGQEMATISHVLYSCVCQIIIKANSALAPTKLISKIKSKILGNLMHGNFTQDQWTLLVKSEHVAVKKLEPGKCKAEETTSKYKGTYKWLLTNPTDTAQTRCIKNEAGNATRICSINMDTGKSQWGKPKFKQCQLLRDLPDKIVDLANITVSDENADDVAKHILNLINQSPFLDEKETEIIVSKLSDISQCDEISMNLTKIILQIIDAVLRKQNILVSDLHQVSNEILRIINRAGHKMEFFGSTANLTVASLALAVLRVDHTFEGMVFSVSSYEEGTDPEINLSEVPLGMVLASIYLPKSLRERIPLSNLQTILFNFFGQTSLFKIKNVTKTLTTYVVSASISDTSIQNLADPVVITLQHIEGNKNYDQVHCAFWDFVDNNGQGGWNSSGCKVKETNISYTICHCDHLTHFGVLMDLSRSAVDVVNERVLVLITYTGCGISSIFLGVAMVTYIAFHKLRKDHPSKILINLCTSLLMLNLVFLFNSWSSSFQTEELCITAAVALHYFLLVSLTWMGLEAVHMYFALVKVFNIYIPNYILKFCLVGWGIPAIMVAIILSVKKELYGTLSSTSPFCWIKDNSLFYISVVAYFCLIFLINFSIFCTVLAQLNSMKSQSQKTRRKMILHDLKGTTSLTFLLGLTWGFAFFAWGPARILFLYLFAIFNTLQGFLIFVFYCVMKESVREQWKINLCCRWLQLDNSSGKMPVWERLKKTLKHKLLTPSLKSTTTGSTFKSLASAQGTPSEISFPNDDFDEDPYYFSPLSCDVVPNCVRRILPVEIKMNSIHKQRSLQ